MKTYNFAKTTETKTYFYDSVLDRFCVDDKPYSTRTVKLNGEWIKGEAGKADKKIIVDDGLYADEIDELIQKAIAA